MKILIIEDDAAVQETLRDMLELHGHTVSSAGSGVEGARLAGEGCDLIFCDIGLPDLDGHEVLKALQQTPETRETPFIFLTARATREDQRQGMTLGADDYITKPFREREILEAITARVGRQRPLRERIEGLVKQHEREASARWSHELLTPLTGVLGGLDLLQMRVETVERKELVELIGLIRASAERQLALAHKIILYFDLERLSGRRQDGERHRCQAQAAILEAVGKAEKAARREGATRVQAGPGGVFLSHCMLTGALVELADNALLYSGPGASVVVTGSRTGACYRIEVVDSGPGMTKEQRESAGAFTQFERNRREQQGLGLGLAIAADTVRIAGGRMTLEEGPEGRGLRVALDLPLAEDPETQWPVASQKAKFASVEGEAFVAGG